MPPLRRRASAEIQSNERERKPERLRTRRRNVGICTPASVRERGCRGRSPPRLVPGLPTRCASHACGGGSVRFLVHGSTAPDCIATGTPCAPPCRRKWQGTSAAVHITVV